MNNHGDRHHEEGRSSREPVNARRQLNILISYRGREIIAAALKVEVSVLPGLLDGSADWPKAAWRGLEEQWDLMRGLGLVEEPVESAADDDQVSVAATVHGRPETQVEEGNFKDVRGGVAEKGGAQ